ncbi:MAG: M56 family metallopeptidase [Dysgonamonadaceae bacterium]|nr:M56 family metallopeptidase [Dysgonamonadaceae bacterium]
MLIVLYNQLFIMSFAFGGLYLILKAINVITSKYFKASWHYYTFTAAYLFLLLPYYKLIPLLGFNQKTPMTLSLPSIPLASDLPLFRDTDIVTATDNVERAAAINLDFMPYLLIIGTIVFIVVVLIQNIQLHYRIFAKCRLEYNAQYQSILAECKQEMGVSNHIRIYISSYAGSPFLYGVFKPRIVLPDIDFTNAELHHIFRHELTHWKRRDAWLKCIMLLVNAIHWFNPLAYMARYDIDRFRELSCDESVVNTMNTEERRCYCELMLGVLWKATGHGVQTFSAFSDKRKQLERRIDMIMKFEGLKKSKFVSALAVVMALALMCGGAITAYAASSDAPEKLLNDSTGVTTTVAEFGTANSHKSANAEVQNSVGGTYTVKSAYDPNEVEPYKVDLSKEFDLAVGKSYQTTFTMDGWGDSHDAFKSKITNVSGTYKYIINGDNGYSYTSDECTSAETFTTTNAKSGVKYTVTIVNTGATKLTGKLNITSYIN